MPLVPTSIISEWYKTDSWVYRSFAFLFCNPLWTNAIPKGVSVCPFFWSALFSLVLFRPFVYLVLGVRETVRLLRLGRLIKWTDSVAPFDGPFAVPTIKTGLVLLLICVVLGLLSIVGWIVWTEIVAQYLAAGIVSTLVLPIVNLVTLVVCTGYYSSHKDDPDCCPVQVYTRIVAGLSLVVAFVLHPVLFTQSFIGYPVEAVGAICGGLWLVLCGAGSLIAATFTYLFLGLMQGAAFVWAGVVAFLALAAYGWVVVRIGGVEEESGADDEEDYTHDKHVIKNRIDRLASSLYCGDHITGYSFSRWLEYVQDHFGQFEEALTAKTFDSDAVARAFYPAILADMNAENEARRVREAKRSALCKKVTTVLMRLVSPVVFVAKQVAIFAVYLWTTIRARKQGWCPYYHFTEVKTDKSSVSTSPTTNQQ